MRRTIKLCVVVLPTLIRYVQHRDVVTNIIEFIRIRLIDEQIKDSVDRWCTDRYEVEIPNKSLLLSIHSSAIITTIDTLSEVSVNPLITQDIHLCSEHKKIRNYLISFVYGYDWLIGSEEQYVQQQDEVNHVRQKSIALIFVNKAKTGDYVLDFVRKVCLLW